MLLAGTRHSCCLSLSGKAIDARTLFVAHRFVGRTRTNRVRAAHHAIPWSHTPHALTSRINGTAGATWLRCRAVAGQVTSEAHRPDCRLHSRHASLDTTSVAKRTHDRERYFYCENVSRLLLHKVFVMKKVFATTDVRCHGSEHQRLT